MTGTVSILNVSTGDTKLSFDRNNVAECIRAARIVSDMIRRGYILLIEVTNADGTKAHQRVKEFREDTCEYIIADFDPITAQKADADAANHEEQTQTEAAPETPAPPKPRGRPPRVKAIHASEANVVGIPRRAGG